MKQKKHNNKRRNTINMRNKRIALLLLISQSSRTKDYQKSNYDNQTDNKDNNGNIDMSMGLGEEKKKLKTKTSGSKGREAIITKRSSNNNIIITIYTTTFNQKYLIRLVIMLCQK